MLLGLTGELPETVDPAAAEPLVAAVRESGRLRLLGTREITFDIGEDIILHRRKRLPFHSNAMRFAALGLGEAELAVRYYYSVGGGFVLGEDEAGNPQIVPDATPVPYPFTTGAELLAHTQRSGLPISGVMLANELVRRDETAVRDGLAHIWTVMQECVQRGSAAEGYCLAGCGSGAAPGRCASTWSGPVTPPTRCMRWSG